MRLLSAVRGLMQKSDSRMRSPISWVAVHDWHQAMWIGGTGVVVTLLWADSELTSWASFHFPVRLAVYLITPLIFAVCVAALLTYHGPESITIPRARVRRLNWSRLLWVLVTSCVGLGGSLLALAVTNGNHVPAIVANFFLFNALALLPVAFRLNSLAWFPPSVLFFAAVMLGHDGDGSSESYYWWAQFMTEDASLWRVGICCVLWVGSILVYLRRSRLRAC